MWEMPLERWRRVIDRNLTSAFLTARGFLAHAATSKRGSLVLVGSTAGQFGEAGHADYAAAKGAIMTGLLLSAKARKRLGTPEDVAGQVVVLASDAVSGHLTGQVVTVAGGMEGRIIP